MKKWLRENALALGILGSACTYALATEGRISTLEADSTTVKAAVLEIRDDVRWIKDYMIRDKE